MFDIPNTNCSKVFDGCGFDAHFTSIPELRNFKFRPDFENTVKGLIPDDVDVDEKFCEPVLDYLDVEMNDFTFFEEDWPRRDNCSFEDTFPIQLEIARRCISDYRNAVFDDDLSPEQNMCNILTHLV